MNVPAFHRYSTADMGTRPKVTYTTTIPVTSPAVPTRYNPVSTTRAGHVPPFASSAASGMYHYIPTFMPAGPQPLEMQVGTPIPVHGTQYMLQPVQPQPQVYYSGYGMYGDQSSFNRTFPPVSSTPTSSSAYWQRPELTVRMPPVTSTPASSDRSVPHLDEEQAAYVRSADVRPKRSGVASWPQNLEYAFVPAPTHSQR